jgi:O-antigen/teichoic acid export membrane protein
MSSGGLPPGKEEATRVEDAFGTRGETFWTSRRWWRRAGQTSAGVWASTALSFLATIIAARGLGPEEYGSVMLAVGVVALVSTFLDVTLEEATVFHGNRALLDADLTGVRALLRVSLKVDVGIGVLVAGALVALAGPIAHAVNTDPTLVRLAALTPLVTTADPTGSAVLLVARLAHLRAWSMAATSVFRLLAVLVAVQIGGGELVVISYAVGGAAGSLVLGMLAWRIVQREWDAGPVRSAAPVSGWTLARFGFHSSAATSVYAVYGSVVPIILGASAGPKAVGIFFVAMVPVIAANVLTGPLRLAMFPEQARLAAGGRVDVLRRYVKGYTLVGFGLGSALAIVAFFVMPWALPLLYSSKFESAVEPARILLIAAVFYAALSWGKTLTAAVGRPQVRTLMAAVELALVAPLVVALADRGAEGGAIAVSAGSVAVGVVWLIVAPRLLTGEAPISSKAASS